MMHSSTPHVWFARLRHLAAWWCACALMLGHALCVAEDLRMLVVLSDNTPVHHDFAVSLKEKLADSAQIRVLQYAEYFSREQVPVDLIVSVGNRASEIVADKALVPILATMLPKSKYAELRLAHPGQHEMSAIYLDQPWHRQLDLIRAALPNKRGIGVLYSADEAKHLGIDALERAVADRKGMLIRRPVALSASLFDDLEQVLEQSEVLLAVPDSEIYNGGTVRNILLSSYRHHVPLIGLSQSYVNAGALCAVFSTPEQLADQVAGMIAAYARTRRLPPPQYPSVFSVAVNREVARTLGVPLLDEGTLLRKMAETGVGDDDL